MLSRSSWTTCAPATAGGRPAGGGAADHPPAAARGHPGGLCRPGRAKGRVPGRGAELGVTGRLGKGCSGRVYGQRRIHQACLAFTPTQKRSGGLVMRKPAVPPTAPVSFRNLVGCLHRVPFGNHIQRLGMLGLLLLCAGPVPYPLVLHGPEAASAALAGPLLSHTPSDENRLHRSLLPL